MDIIVSTGKYNDKSGVISKVDIYMLVVTLTCYIFFKINWYTRHFEWVGILIFFLLQK